MPVPDTLAARSASIGKAISGASIYLRGPCGLESPPYCRGEIVVRGAGVALGYLGSSEFSGFGRDADGAPEYATGDLGYLDHELNLHFIGRRDAQVKIRGHRVDLLALEALFMSDSLVDGAAAVVDDRRDAQCVVLFVQSGTTGIDLVQRLEALAHRELPAALRPAAFHVLTRIAN